MQSALAAVGVNMSFMEILSEWQSVLLWASGLSLLAALATLAGVPWVVVRLPRDYFTRPRREVWRLPSSRPVVGLALAIFKNLLGLVLVILGLIMLVTPGQGLATLLIGFLLMNFPGKFRVEQWLVSRSGVMKGLNWLRLRQDKPPFDEPAAERDH